LQNPGNIVDQVWQGIRGWDAVVADITRHNPNVFYEIGLAHALGKEVILLSQDVDAPFDIRSSRRLNYDLNGLTALKTNLEAAFLAISARYPHEGPEPRF
jgi:nucleoside 2-deoxyribosyltransferase